MPVHRWIPRLSITLPYLAIIVLWSTTPLGMKWSTEGIDYMLGVSGRMVIGLLLCTLALAAFRRPLPVDRRSWAAFVVAGLALFIAMSCTYWGARFIPSGWIALVFALNPIITAVLAAYWLQERSLTASRLVGLGLGLAGIALIFADGFRVGQEAVLGLLAVLAAVTAHSTGAVAVKRLNPGHSGLVVTTGALVIAVPLFLSGWALTASGIPETIPPRTAGAILYLGVFGSFAGFILYFHLLRQVEASRVALIPLITPVTALFIGHWVNQEPLLPRVLVGAGCIVIGLLIFEWHGLRRGWRRNQRSGSRFAEPSTERPTSP